MPTDKTSVPSHLTTSNHGVSERTDMLDSTRWTNGFTHAQLGTLAKYMDSFEVGEGETILHEGGNDAQMLLVVDGKVNAVKDDGNGSLKVIATIGTGGTFGEMSLIDGQPRSASAVAATDVTLLLLSKESFEEVTESFPELGVRIYARLSKMLSQRLRQTTGRLVDHL